MKKAWNNNLLQRKIINENKEYNIKFTHSNQDINNILAIFNLIEKFEDKI